MTDRTSGQMGETRSLTCVQADELDAAYAVGALDAEERAAVEQHLATCPEPHAELRALLGAGEVLDAALAPVAPSPALRDRLMATVAATPQDHVAVERTRAEARTQAERQPRRSWFGWLSPAWARGLAAAAVVLALIFGSTSLYLSGQLSSRDEALRAVAEAIGGGQAAVRVTGSAGSGYLVTSGSGGASLVVADLGPPASNRIYELWLIGSDNTPIAVGTFAGSSAPVAVVPLERGISGFAVFAVTIEARRVDAPTSQPVMVGKLQT